MTVICYDIENDLLRQRVATLLVDSGARRVQKSVFEFDGQPRQLAALRKRLSRLRGATDSIIYYTVCASCARHSIYDKGTSA